jgi:hypothetical protein
MHAMQNCKVLHVKLKQSTKNANLKINMNGPQSSNLNMYCKYYAKFKKHDNFQIHYHYV